VKFGRIERAALRPVALHEVRKIAESGTEKRKEWRDSGVCTADPGMGLTTAGGHSLCRSMTVGAADVPSQLIVSKARALICDDQTGRDAWLREISDDLVADA